MKNFIQIILKKLLPLILLFSFQSCKTEKDYLLDAAVHGNLASKARAIEKLATTCKDEKCRKVITNALYDHHPLIRRKAALALGKQKIINIWPLLHTLSDSDLRVRLNAIHSLLQVKNNPEVLYAMTLKLSDNHLLLKKNIINFLKKAGFTTSDILEVTTFQNRFAAIKAIAKKTAANRAYGIKLLADNAKSIDYGFIIRGITSTDPFILRNSLYGFSDGEKDGLEIISKTLLTKEKYYAMDLWIEKSTNVDKTALNFLLKFYSLQDLFNYKSKIKTALPCKLLYNLNNEKYVELFKFSQCDFNKIKNNSIKLKFLLVKKIKPTDKILKETEINLDKLGGGALAYLLYYDKFETEIFNLLKNKWFQYLYWNTKWIDEKTWEKLDYTGVDAFKPSYNIKLTPKERFLNQFKQKIKNYEEITEFIPSKFNVDAFALQISALYYLKSFTPIETEFLTSLLNYAPNKVKLAILKVFSKKHNGIIKMPPAINKLVLEGNENQKVLCIKILSVFNKTNLLLKILNQSDDYIQIKILKELAKVGGNKIVKILMEKFKKQPTAQLAQVLSKLKVKEAAKIMKDILDTETPETLAKERAIILESCMKINPAICKENLQNEIWNNSEIVRIASLKYIDDISILKAFEKHDNSLFVRKTAKNRLIKLNKIK